MKHAAIIPLAGGAVIGASQALGKPPEYMASWDAFAKNDAYAKAYYPNVQWHSLDKTYEGQLPKVDLITCVPPCSGLSTATPSSARGCKAPQNEHMLKVAECGMRSKTETIIIENAPTLYSPAGAEFAERFLPLCDKYHYSMVLYKTSTILHGLPQNRVRSFVLLFKGAYVPQADSLWVKRPYKPMHDWPIVKGGLSSKWDWMEDELIDVLVKEDYLKFCQGLGLPLTAWNIFNKMKIKHKFKTAPYKYMQQRSKEGHGIMDRSPYIVYDHSNALMWKSAHKMFNPWARDEQYNIRELMNFMGMPKNYKEIPAKDINVLFQNVPVTTVKTLVENIVDQRDMTWVKANGKIVRYNNIKQTVDLW